VTTSDLPVSLPAWSSDVLDDLVPRLATVPGIAAVVLGGSLARSRGSENSDLDVGLLYHDDAPLDLAALQRVVEEVNDDLTTQVTPLGGWGPWVNGGAWLHIDGHPVDLLYRSIDRYRATIENARNGYAEHDYLQQPPYGFQSTIYLGEMDTALALHDPTGILAALKLEVRPYPPALQSGLSRGYHWGAEFAVSNARKPAARGDIYAVIGCLSRAVAFLVQSLYAVNEVYFISDKGAIDEVETMAMRPDNWAGRVDACLSVTSERSSLAAAVDVASALVEECRSLV
jgi:predicted nucleotidyltransferase